MVSYTGNAQSATVHEIHTATTVTVDYYILATIWGSYGTSIPFLDMNFFHVARKTLSIWEGWRSLFDTSTSPPLALELAVLNTKSQNA